MNYNPDLYWRGGIEDVFDELLRLVFNGADDLFDMERGFEFLDKELQNLFPEAGNKPDGRYVDKLVKVFRKDGKEEWILIHVEVQGYDSGDFPLRMFTYFYRIFEKHKVPITSISIFTTEKKPKNAGFFHYEVLGTRLSFEYNAIHIFDYTEDHLLSMKSAIGIMLLAAQKAVLRKKIPDESLAEQRLMLAKAFLENGTYSKDKILRILAFVKNVVHIENKEINHNFDHVINELNKIGNYMGILELIQEEKKQEGKLEGKVEEKKNLIRNLITQLNLSDELVAGVAEVTVEYVRKIRDEMDICK